MTPQTAAAPNVGMFAFMAELGRALFKSNEGDRQRDSGPHYWTVMFIDENGVLQHSTVRVLAVHPELRSLTVWCDASGRERTLKVSKIVEARDLGKGRRVNLANWLQAHRPAGG